MPRMQDAVDKRTAAASIDAYAEANLLMGQATHPSLEDLTQRALKIKERNERLYVHWTSAAAGVECQAVGPATRCFCTHSYSSHAWYETTSKRVKCRVDGCRCTCFSYVPGRGATHIRCACKHEHHEHRSSDGRSVPCHHPGCGCPGFNSTWRCAAATSDRAVGEHACTSTLHVHPARPPCTSTLHVHPARPPSAPAFPPSRRATRCLTRCGSCGEPFDAHATTFETAAERARAGKSSEANLGGWSDEKPHLDAVCGGVTRMSSLLSGVERVGIAPLPLTDACEPCADDEQPAIGARSSTAAVFANYDRRADAHVGRLRKLKELSESARFAGGAPGHRLGGVPPSAALVPRPPDAPSGAAAAKPGGSGARKAAASARAPPGAARPVINSNRPPAKGTTRELAAAAAERRLTVEPVAEQSAAPASAASTASTAPKAAAAPAPKREPPAVTRTGSARGSRPRGQAKAAVAAVRRERTAEAAEARLAQAQQARDE
jgi:hypothetical protein